MGLNIKSDEAISLTRQLATLTGESLTGAITTAVAERLVRVRASQPASDADAQVERILAVAHDMRVRLSGELPDHDELLYGADGLPR
ncbi:MAG: type II toxin-antitoxin system VapB family antitoxin [Jatrophihabitantaceae bacterium]